MDTRAAEIEALYEERYANCRHEAAAILGDLDAAHDAVQDGFARALASRDTALSPDERYALGGWVPVAGQDSASPFVRVVESRTGRVVAHVDLTRVAMERRPQIVVPGWPRRGVLGAQPHRRRASDLERPHTRVPPLRPAAPRAREVLRLEQTSGLDIGYGRFFGNPSFVDAAARDVTVRAHAVSEDERRVATVFLTCDRVTRTCTRGRGLPARRWLILVETPSRPFPNRGFLAGG